MPSVSIHALLAECDIRPERGSLGYRGFNPRTPCGVRLGTGRNDIGNREFQSTHSLRSATHTLASVFLDGRSFNPRTPCGVRPPRCVIDKQGASFQSTHSLRSATVPSGESGFILKGFNPRTPCGVRQEYVAFDAIWCWFQSTHSLRSATAGCEEHWTPVPVSIHALLAECDLINSSHCLNSGMFQSTHSLRSATQQVYFRFEGCNVSIHALLAECDDCNDGRPNSSKCFNPRTPCGVRQRGTCLIYGTLGFNPRTPCGVRPGKLKSKPKLIYVSIHALLAECDRIFPEHLMRLKKFQSTHSLRSATP